MTWITHYERGLEPKYRIAVRQARCADVASAMAEVDIVADAHELHVVLPDNIANIPASAPDQTTTHMGVEPMQISLIRNKNERKNQSRIQNGPRQGRNNGPSSSEVICFNCGRRGHYARRCKLIKRVQVSMLLSPLMLTEQESLSQPATLSTIPKDDDKVNNRSFEGAVHTAIQAEVPSNLLYNNSSRRQKSHGTRQPVRKTVVTRQQSAVSDHHRVSPIIGQTSWEATRLIEPCVEHEGHYGSCVHATFPAAERERRMVRPRGTPSAARGSQKGTRTNQTSDASLQPRPITRRRRPTTRSIRFGQALKSTRPTSVAANSSAPTMATPSVFVPPQATAIQRLGKENIPPPAEPVRRLPRVRRTHTIGRPAAVSAGTGTPRGTVSSVGAHSMDLQPVSPMFLDVEVFCHAVKPAIRVATTAMLDTGSSLSFISTRLFQCLPKSVMKPTSFNAQMANGSALAVKKCCILNFKLLHGSHPDITCHVKFCVIRLPPQVDILLGAPFHRDHI